MKYRCKHKVESLQWHDTDKNRERFADWFDTHVFFLSGAEVSFFDDERRDFLAALSTYHELYVSPRK